MTQALIGVVMGSSSDWDTMQHAVQILQQFGIPHDARVVSAHRMPDDMFAYAEAAAGRGLVAIIAGAGGAAHLTGMLAAKNPTWDDDRLFETARNIVIVMFIKIVVEEYINHINTTEFPLQADPKVAWRAKWNRPNWMTVEFSLLYRWHGLVMENVTWGDKAHPGNSLLLNNSLLIGSGLAQSFVNTSANRTAMLGLENAASFMMFAETGAINQARINNVTSYNDYRLAMGMEPARNFAAIVGSSDTPAEQARLSALAKRLEGLYGDVNNVEYYIGLFAERVEKNGPLPELVSSMVAMDAFSQALTNPLLSEHVWGNPANKRLAFTEDGIKVIEQTKRLRDIVDRNAKGLGNAFVGMTRKEWKLQSLQLGLVFA